MGDAAIGPGQAGRLVVGISGASGAVLGVRLLEVLHGGPIETHLVVTPAAQATLLHETGRSLAAVQALAHTAYDPADVGAAIASGSFATLGMLIVPCSIKTLSAVANAYGDNLLTRAADVTLKEGRPLLLAVREAPLHVGHLRLMHLAAQSGAIIFPPVPQFYAQPTTLAQVVDGIVGRMLARLGIANPHYTQWGGGPLEDGTTI